MAVRYTTYGSGRQGCGHKHRSLEAANRCLDRDARGCAKQGGYSDRVVCRIDEDGYISNLTESEMDELLRIRHRLFYA